MYDIYYQLNRPGVLDPSGVLNSTVSQAFGLLPAQNVIPLDLQQIIRQRRRQIIRQFLMFIMLFAMF